MNRIQTIAQILQNTLPTTFKELGLDAQTMIAYSCAKSTNASLKFWLEQLDDVDIKAEFEKRARQEIRDAQMSLTSIFCFLDRAANYIEAQEQMILYDTASINIESGDVEADETVPQRASVKAHPHAWARTNLIDSGVWPTEDARSKAQIKDDEAPRLVPISFGHMAKPLVLLCLDKVMPRLAGRFIGKLIVSMASTEALPKNMGKDLTIICMCPQVLSLKDITVQRKLEADILQLAKDAPPYINDKSYSAKDMVQLWLELKDADEDDAAAASIKTEVKELGLVVRESVRATMLMATLTSGIERLTKAGALPEVIAQLTASVMAQLTPKVAVEAPPAINPFVEQAKLVTQVAAKMAAFNDVGEIKTVSKPKSKRVPKAKNEAAPAKLEQLCDQFNGRTSSI